MRSQHCEIIEGLLRRRVEYLVVAKRSESSLFIIREGSGHESVSVIIEASVLMGKAAYSPKKFAPDRGRSQHGAIGCSRNVRSSSLCTVESSALIGHGGVTRGVVDVSKGVGSAQGPARSQKTAHYAKAGSGRAEA